MKHVFGCIDKCCEQSASIDGVVLNRDVGVELVLGSSPSLTGIVASGALARDIHRGERSKALPNAPNDPTALVAGNGSASIVDSPTRFMILTTMTTHHDP